MNRQLPVGKNRHFRDQCKLSQFEFTVNMAGEGDENVLDGPLPGAATSSNELASGNSEANVHTEQLGDKKRVRSGSQDVEMADSSVKRQKGVAPVKAE
jgi:tRNA-dihydrouridine synthase 3